MASINNFFISTLILFHIKLNKINALHTSTSKLRHRSCLKMNKIRFPNYYQYCPDFLHRVIYRPLLHTHEAFHNVFNSQIDLIRRFADDVRNLSLYSSVLTSLTILRKKSQIIDAVYSNTIISKIIAQIRLFQIIGVVLFLSLSIIRKLYTVKQRNVRATELNLEDSDICDSELLSNESTLFLPCEVAMDYAYFKCIFFDLPRIWVPISGEKSDHHKIIIQSTSDSYNQNYFTSHLHNISLSELKSLFTWTVYLHFRSPYIALFLDNKSLLFKHTILSYNQNNMLGSYAHSEQLCRRYISSAEAYEWWYQSNRPVFRYQRAQTSPYSTTPIGNALPIRVQSQANNMLQTQPRLSTPISVRASEVICHRPMGGTDSQHSFLNFTSGYKYLHDHECDRDNKVPTIMISWFQESETSGIPRADVTVVTNDSLLRQLGPDPDIYRLMALVDLSSLPIMASARTAKYLYLLRQKCRGNQIAGSPTEAGKGRVVCAVCTQMFKNLDLHIRQRHSSKGCYNVAKSRHFLCQSLGVPFRQPAEIPAEGTVALERRLSEL